jgi:hypothetical protein
VDFSRWRDGMKVLNLQCDTQHPFEGWFSDEADYQQQLKRRLLRCPMCDSDKIIKLPSAPRLNLSGASASTEAESVHSSHAASESPTELMSLPQAQLQKAMMQAMRQMMSNTKDVGERFAEEARRMHYGEAPHEAIRGRASREEAEALHDEGIEFMAMPSMPALKEPLQ